MDKRHKMDKCLDVQRIKRQSTVSHVAIIQTLIQLTQCFLLDYFSISSLLCFLGDVMAYEDVLQATIAAHILSPHGHIGQLSLARQVQSKSFTDHRSFLISCAYITLSNVFKQASISFCSDNFTKLDSPSLPSHQAGVLISSMRHESSTRIAASPFVCTSEPSPIPLLIAVSSSLYQTEHLGTSVFLTLSSSLLSLCHSYSFIITP